MEVITLTDETVVPSTDSRIQLSRLILAVQSAVRVTSVELRKPRHSRPVNQIWMDYLVKSHCVRYIITSSVQAVIEVDPEQEGNLVVCLTPLIGNQDLDTSLTSVFGIFNPTWSNKISSGETITERVLKPGKDLVAAGYAIYGASTLLVLASQGGTVLYQLDPSIGEFVLMRKLTVPAKGNIFSNLNLQEDVSPNLSSLRTLSTDGKNGETTTSANVVLDVHSLLVKGGSVVCIVGVGLLYLAGPLAYIVEKAGGKARAEAEEVCDIIPRDIHTKITFKIGSSRVDMNTDGLKEE